MLYSYEHLLRPRPVTTTYLVKGVLDLSELLGSKSTGVNALYFASEVTKLGRVN